MSISPDNILHQADEIIPGAGDKADDYLRAVARNVLKQEMPFDRDVRPEKLTGGWRDPKTDCLVLKPTEPRLRRYEMLHFGLPMGRNLKVGYYIVGALKAQGLIGVLGGPTRTQMDHFESLVQLVEEFGGIPFFGPLTVRAEWS